MTARGRAAPAGGVATPVGELQAGAGAAALRFARRLASAAARPFRRGPPSAGDLTDRQLADIGLTRSDLPDHRGWRR